MENQKTEKYNFSNMIKNVSSVLYVIFILFLIYSLWNSSHTTMGQETNTPDFESINYVKQIDKEEIKPYKRPKIMKKNMIEIRISDRNNVVENTLKQDIITYKSFKKIIGNDKFIKMFMNALQLNYENKKQRYVEIYNKNLVEFNVEKKRQNGKHSISKMNSLNRYILLLSEIKDILNCIETKIKNLNAINVRESLYKCMKDNVDGLKSLESRTKVKNKICLQLFAFAKNPNNFINGFQNILIYGSSGIGKTKIAKVLSFVYSNCGILVRDRISFITKNELTTAYVNESGNITRDMLIKTLDGVCFIDEAYDLAPANTFGKDHGEESITEMINFMDKHEGLSIIIAAGYKDKMINRFMKSNEGMQRRFPHVFDLCGYSTETLTHILLKYICENEQKICFSDEEATIIHNLIEKCQYQESTIFDKQAGDMVNLGGHILRCIYGTINKNWINQDFKNNISMIISGFNTFIESKGYNFVLN